MKKHNIHIGNFGEKIALKFLRDHSYHILHTNFRCGKIGEIDIIAKKDEQYVFVEVKTRTSQKHGQGQEAVNKHKRKTITRLANIYIQKHFKWEEVSWRVDIIDVFIHNKKNYVTHIVNIQ